jgi:D-glycero-D-manno-heptose 1,7-bisphosphate phosphatase
LSPIFEKRNGQHPDPKAVGQTGRKAAFLDRDGVINLDRHYVYRERDFEFVPQALAACRRFVDAGYLLVVITNQAGIARGYYTVGDFKLLTVWMTARFEEAGARLSGVYYCPHHPDAASPALRQICECRKPAPGLILEAQRELDLDLSRSFLVGDKLSDIQAGHAAGVGHCFLVRTGHKIDWATEQQLGPADTILADLSEVADWLKSEQGAGQETGKERGRR